MKLKTVSAIALLSCSALNVNADSLYLGAWSKHIVSGDYNERHNLIAYEKDKWLVGTFENSYYRRTYIAGKELYSYSKWNIDLRLYGGLTYGYTMCYGDDGSSANVCPAIVPEISYTKYKVQPSVIVFAEAVALTFKVQF